MKRRFVAADSHGLKRCAETVNVGRDRKSQKHDDRAQCQRAAVEGDYCRQHAAIRAKEGRTE